MASANPRSKRVDFLAGIAAGTLSACIMHPLDLVRVRLQVGTASHFGTLIKEMVHTPSLAYRGLGLSLVANAAAWGSYYALYGQAQDFFTQTGLEKGPAFYLVSALSAGVVAQVTTAPLWVVKTRVTGSNAAANVPVRTLQVAKSIYASAGVLGFYRGLIPSFLGTAQGSIYFMLYDSVRPHMPLHWRSSQRYFVASAGCKIVATTLLYPHQVVKSRMQFTNYGIWHTICAVYRSSGWRGFYHGLGANLLRVVPSMCVVQVAFETCSVWFAGTS